MHQPESVADSLGSVTCLYQRVVDGDCRATGALWDAYCKRLYGLARAVLRQRGIAPAQASEDSVVNAAFAKFFAALSQGKYREVADRHELWCLLAVITRNTAIHHAKRAGKQMAYTTDVESFVLQQADASPTPAEVAALSDTISDLEQRIRARSTDREQADRIIRVMSMTLCGYTQREIAAAIGKSEVTVRRNLKLVRDLLNHN
jgi:DNA-directed RNA polymerase specialized sigma24 family protein